MTKAQCIKKARKAKQLSPAALAGQLGVSRSRIHAWEHGGPGPSLKNMRKLSEVLEVPLIELVEAS